MDLGSAAQRLRLISETISEVVWMATYDMRELIYISPAYEEVWGRNVQSLFDDPRSWLEAMHPEDVPRILADIDLQKDGLPFEHEYRITRPDGAVRWILDRGYPVREEDGRARYYVGVARDITERKELEAQLRQAQKMDAVGQLAGGIAHDFNNILQAVTLQLTLLTRTGGLSAAAAEHVHDIRSAIDRAAGLTRQFLVFSRREPMRPRWVDLNAVVAELARLLNRIVGEDIAFQLQLGKGTIPLLADEGMLGQVILNLAVNARDAMPRGGTLTISTCVVHRDAEGVRPGGSFVCITVRDTGTGIAPEAVPRIFEPYFTTKAPDLGTGLGLAVTFGIVAQHGGWIEVDTEVGVGTAFHTLLPLGPSSQSVAEVPASAAEPGAGGKHETIMVVEDDGHVRRLMRTVLELDGYRVLEADCGHTALRVWDHEAGQIDLVLTDVIMPGGMDGVELASKLAERRPGIPVILATGYSKQLADEGTGRHQALLQKPITPEALLGTVRACLDA